MIPEIGQFALIVALCVAFTQAVVPLARFWQQITGLEMLEAVTFISFGVVCLLYGWRVFKILVVINFGLLGLVMGMAVIDKINGLNNPLMGGLVGMGIYHLLMEKGTSKRVPLFSSANVDFLLPVYPEDEVTVFSEKEYFRFNKLKCRVKMTNQHGEKVCEGYLSGFMMETNK